MGTRGSARHQKLRKESVMKCSNPECNRGIGLVAYRRGWFKSGATVQSIAAMRSWLMRSLSFIGVTAKRLAECGTGGSSSTWF
jgi:hypothetical protein